ncbi:NAD-dependent epimerase/dehydratase family protein [uncultured Mailhella sp.]|uniref:NAD-dependent epimerase/dehydratase family protein n=1 Tax=uncultured Mailhella sp. TaxID=1981031 RepID=UPI0025E768E5|nr:NAD-dependent epimerase/dehydratase family protein [uncultured Mailhella sp.]
MTHKILVTGAGGFIGRHVTEILGKLGYYVMAMTRKQHAEWTSLKNVNTCSVSLLDKEGLESLIMSFKPDIVIHLAAIASPTHNDIMEIFQTNVKGSENLLEGLRKHCPAGTRVVLTSTAGVYGNVPLKNIPETTPYSPMNYYGLSKVTMELLAKRYVEFDIRILRPFNIIGVGQKENFLIPKLVRAFASRQPILKVGNLETVRDYTDVLFGSQVFVQMALRDDCSDKILNLCSGHGTAGVQIVEYLRQITGYSPEIVVDKSFIRRGEIMRLVGDSSRLKTFMTNGTNPLEVKEILAQMVTDFERQTA